MPAERPLKIGTSSFAAAPNTPGAWCWIAENGQWNAGHFWRTTDAELALFCLADLLLRTTGPVEVRMNNPFVRRAIGEGWWRRWVARDWWTRGQRVRHRELWQLVIRFGIEPGRLILVSGPWQEHPLSIAAGQVVSARTGVMRELLTLGHVCDEDCETATDHIPPDRVTPETVELVRNRRLARPSR